MRVIFGALSLLVVLAIVGVLAKKQLGSVAAPAPVPAAGGVIITPGSTPKQQVQQVQQAVQGAMEQARPMPDDTK